MADGRSGPLKRIFKVLQFQKAEISAIYFYAILNGLVQLSLPLGIQSIISFVLGGSISTSIIVLIVLVVAGVYFNGQFQVSQMKLNEKIQQQLFVRYSFDFSYRIPKLNLKGVDQYYLPELVNRFFDIVSLQKGLSKLLLEFPTAIIQIFFGLLLLSFYHPVFIFFGLVLVLIVYLILRFSSSQGLQTSLEESNHKYDMAGWLQELGRVVTSFKFSKGAHLHYQRTDSYLNKYLDARTRHFNILKLQYWTLVGLKLAITATMLIVGSVLLVNQQLNIGQFIAAEIIILTVIASVEKLIVNLDSVYDVLTAVEKLGKLSDQELEKDGLQELSSRPEGIQIGVQGLSFGYMVGENVLHDLTFTASPGEKIQVIGANGSGKSSLIRLLSGAYQPFDGVISMDGLPINNYTLESLRRQTGIMLNTQDLFKGTIRDNITMGNQQVSLHEIHRIAALIGLGEFLLKTEQGLEMELNPTGHNLPRRIVQKLLLLRALVMQPRLLLLEEPWLGLEPQYTQQIKDYLLRQLPATTCFVVSNDTTYSHEFDTIIWIDKGRIRAQGKWSEVMQYYTTD